MNNIASLMLIFVMFIVSSISGQNPKPTEQSNKEIDFEDFISGVKIAVLVFNDETQRLIDRGEEAEIVSEMVNYCKSIGIKTVLYRSTDKKKLNQTESICDQVTVAFTFERRSNYIANIRITFYSCLYDYFVFESNRKILFSEGRGMEGFQEELQNLYNRKNPVYSLKNRLTLPTRNSEWTKESLIKRYEMEQTDPVEGVWESVRVYSDEIVQSKYLIGIVKNNNYGYDIIYLDGADNKGDWKEGEFKGWITKSATNNFYSVKWLMADKEINKDVYCKIDENSLLSFIFSNSPGNKNSESKFLKLYPTDNAIYSNPKSTATAFAISKDGYILTCFHVTKSKNTFKLIISNDESTSFFTLTKIGEDPNNDLALLKISDPSFNGFQSIPFIIREKQSDVGDEIFTLGFPLTTSMGNEIKLTNGIISSRSGFQGDLTTYQISAAVQPGNSGGPVFDRDGGLVGVISAKHVGAENVSYAIKSNIINNLLESLNIKPEQNIKNILKGKSLSEQVKALRNYVFLIEVE